MGRKEPQKPKLAVWKFASCDGCQLSLLDAEDELLAIGELVTIAHFPEATRNVLRGPYDLSLVEGSITTPEDRERIQRIRRESRVLISIGACATSGGVQALRNMADVNEFIRLVYATPSYISTLDRSTPISQHVKVDFELTGCPINKSQLLELLRATLLGVKPNIPAFAVCVECKRRGNPCLLVARGEPCLGPVTHAGCGAICPSFNRGCYGCYGPSEDPNTGSLVNWLKAAGRPGVEVAELFKNFNTAAPEFVEAQKHALAKTAKSGRKL